MDGIRQVGGMNPFPDMRKSQATKKGAGFADTLKHFAAEVNDELYKADGQMEEFAVGKQSDLQDVVVASEKADLSFKLLLQVRNKLLEAYQEIMRMQV
jgi:flagellar hook-basal body complex protein FliE